MKRLKNKENLQKRNVTNPKRPKFKWYKKQQENVYGSHPVKTKNTASL